MSIRPHYHAVSTTCHFCSPRRASAFDSDPARRTTPSGGPA
ncbi:hypothetical protein ACIGDI_19205 [Streptomyces sp. NPDC085900]